MITLERIGWTPVKGFRLQYLDRASVAPHGLAHDRDFLVFDEHGELNLYDISALLQVVAGYDAARDELTFTFPDGSSVTGSARPAGERFVLDYLLPRPVQYLANELDELLTDWAGRPVRLARVEQPGAGVDVLPISILSSASVTDLGARAGRDLSSRRFRANLEISGVAAYQEETWTGRPVRIGSALLRMSTPIPRCAITGFDPETGKRDGVPLRTLNKYRPVVGLPPDFPEHTSVPFAVYAEVLEPGEIAVGQELVVGE